MKLKKVAALCSQSGIFYLYDQIDENGEVVCQWLGDGCAAYPITGLPYMDTDNICAMFDIPEKKQEKMIFRHTPAPVDINWEDTDTEEWKIDDPRLCVRHEGREMLPLRTTAGLTFIQEKYLAPLDNLDYMNLYERRSKSGGVYIVAKIGMMVQAVIMPMDVVTDDLVDRLDELTRMCRSALLRKNWSKTGQEQAERADAVDKGQDTLFQEGADAGEGGVNHAVAELHNES